MLRSISWLPWLTWGLLSFSSVANAVTESIWLTGNSSTFRTDAQVSGTPATDKGSDPHALLVYQCSVYYSAYPNRVLTGSYGAFSSEPLGKYSAACQRQQSGTWGGDTGLYATQMFRCVAGGSWTFNLSGCAPYEPCANNAAGSAASGTGFIDMGTNPDKPDGYVSCEGGCLATFQGDFPVKVGLTDGIAHYYGQGGFKWTGQAADSCSTGDHANPTPTTPADTCPTGQAAVNTTLASGGPGTPKCVNKQNGQEGDPDDKNNDGKPDSCQPGSYSTADGWDVTVTWNASTSTCTQHGTKSGKPDIDYSGGPNQPKPFTDPHPITGPDNNTPSNPGGPALPGADPITEYCKSHPDAALCKKSTTGGACLTFTCSGDAAACATAKSAELLKCAYDNTKTLAEVLTDSGLGSSNKAAFLASTAGTSTDISTILQTNQRDLSGSCPAPLPVVTPWKTVSVSFNPLCDIAGIIGVMVMLAATFVSVRLLAGGAG